MTSRLFLLVLLAGFIGNAQVNTGSLIGTVTDASGATVSGASVDILDGDTAVAAALRTNERGIYRSPFLWPGSYSVRVEAKGFKTSETRQVLILVGKETALNVNLEVGLVAESITVDGAAPIVATTTAQASVNMDSKKVLALPRLNAGIDRLALLAPGVAMAQPTVTTNGATLAVNGQRRRANNFLIDGQDNNHAGFSGPSFPFNNVDVVAEYQIITNQFSAEYGKSQGGIVNIATRAGSNRLNGTATWLHQNDAIFTALTNIQRRSGLDQPPKTIDNLFGATLGGPIRRNKAFFFGYFNRQFIRRDSRLEASQSQWTPTSDGLEALRLGFPDSNSVRVLQQYGPLARGEGNPQFLAGVRRVDTLVGAAGQPVAIEEGRLVRTLHQPADARDFGTREDFSITSKDRLTARFFYRDRLGLKEISNLGGYSSDFHTAYHNAGVSWIRSIRPTVVNEARFGYNKEREVWSGADGSPFSDIGKNIANFTINAGYLGFGLPVNYPQDAGSRSFEFQDNLSLQAGRHTVKVGGQFWRVHGLIGNRRTYNGAFQFSSFQDFANNRPSAFNASAGDLEANIIGQSRAAYLQDDIHLKPNLTLNLGVRYESATQPASSLHDATVQRERDTDLALWDTTLPLSVRTVPLPPPDRNNWAPRIGFAYTPRFARRLTGQDATVIRGGYSIGYEFGYLFQAISVFSSAPTGERYTLAGIPVPEDPSGDNLRRLTDPPRVDPRQQAQFQFAPDLHSPYAQTWSLGVQRRVALSHAFEIRYAGSRGLSLFQTRNGNPNARLFIDAGFANVLPAGLQPGSNSSCSACNGRVDPQFGQVALLANTASSIYHSLQSRYDGRFANQLVLGATYTWSRAIDNTSDLLASAPNIQAIAQNPFDLTRGERGPSDFDLTHIATVHFVWDVPWLKLGRGALAKLLAGWTFSGIQRWNTGRPITPYQQDSGTPTVNDRAFNTNFIGAMFNDTTRPFSANPDAPGSSAAFVLANGNLVDLSTRSRPVTLDQVRWIYNNLAAEKLFGMPFGSGRNVARAPGFKQTDLALYKTFNANERVTVQLRFESTNSFNHPNLGPGDIYIESAGFWNPTETEAEPRRFAAGLRIRF